MWGWIKKILLGVTALLGVSGIPVRVPNGVPHITIQDSSNINMANEHVAPPADLEIEIPGILSANLNKVYQSIRVDNSVNIWDGKDTKKLDLPATQNQYIGTTADGQFISIGLEIDSTGKIIQFDMVSDKLIGKLEDGDIIIEERYDDVTGDDHGEDHGEELSRNPRIMASTLPSANLTGPALMPASRSGCPEGNRFFEIVLMVDYLTTKLFATYAALINYIHQTMAIVSTNYRNNFGADVVVRDTLIASEPGGYIWNTNGTVDKFQIMNNLYSFVSFDRASNPSRQNVMAYMMITNAWPYGGVVGLSWLASGGTALGTGYAQNRDPLTTGTILTHELGHILGAPHDGELPSPGYGECRNCSCQGLYIMNPYNIRVGQFSRCSQDRMCDYLNGRDGSRCYRPVVCGDKVCTSFEARGQPGFCSKDCSICGDGICDDDENPIDCLNDCSFPIILNFDVISGLTNLSLGSNISVIINWPNGSSAASSGLLQLEKKLMVGNITVTAGRITDGAYNLISEPINKTINLEEIAASAGSPGATFNFTFVQYPYKIHFTFIDAAGVVGKLSAVPAGLVPQARARASSNWTQIGLSDFLIWLGDKENVTYELRLLGPGVSQSCTRSLYTLPDVDAVYQSYMAMVAVYFSAPPNASVALSNGKILTTATPEGNVVQTWCNQASTYWAAANGGPKVSYSFSAGTQKKYILV